MAKGVDELIEDLVSSIAVAGHRGVSINDIATSISAFYDKSDEESTSLQPAEPTPAATAPSSTGAANVTVDRQLLAKVWSWLGRHPDISIGDNGRYNTTPLAQIEAEFPNYLDVGAPDKVNDDDSQQGVATPRRQTTQKKSRASQGPRIYLNEERLYAIICGHPPDSSRVPRLEFELLSYIAATKSRGILQGELVKLSGQDKRSVPKRTDALHRKGYIVKETVFHRGNRTSRLRLKKFIKEDASDNEEPPQRGSTVQDVVRRIFDVLPRQNLTSQKDLAQELCLGSPAEFAVLQKTIRRLEILKCVKRVRTAIGPSATSHDLELYVQLLRHPESEDLQNFNTETLSLDQTVAELSLAFDPQDPASTSFPQLPILEESVEPSRGLYRPARWNPDRLMPNILIDTVYCASSGGLTNINARQMVTGDFMRRQLEAILHRLSVQSLLIQPPWLRHLAIIRRVVIEDGVTKYIHCSWDEFTQLVNEQDLDFSSIPGAKQALDSIITGKERPEKDAAGQSIFSTDEFGFPLQSPPALQARRGEVTFSDLVGSAAAGDVEQRVGDFIIVEEGKKLALDVRRRLTTPVSAAAAVRSEPPSASRKSRKQQSRPKPDEDVIRGRPRKYMRGTEKFWRTQFKQIKMDTAVDPENLEKGLMDDPHGKEVYAHRPQHFDETLVEAIAAKLPVPIGPRDIDDDWVALTRRLLDRPSRGIYMSLKGLRFDDYRKFSQVMIFKSSRLSSVDFSDRSKVHPFRFISSSASHSFSYRRYYPSMPSDMPPINRVVLNTKRQKGTQFRDSSDGKKIGPRLGIFFEDSAIPTSSSIRNPVTQHNPVELSIDVSAEAIVAFDERDSTISPVDETGPTPDTAKKDRRGSSQAPKTNDIRSPVSNDSALPNKRHENSDKALMRPPRKRKLTEKATALLTTIQDRQRRKLSETRSIASDSSTAEQSPQRLLQSADVLYHRDESLTGIQGAAAAKSLSPSQKPLRDQIPGPLAESVVSATTPPTTPVREEFSPTTNTNTVEDLGENDTRDSQSVRRPNKTKYQKYTRGANSLCRRIILELIDEASGVVPNDAYTLRRISATRWQEAGEEDRPLLKTVKTVIKHLCESGKLQQLTFSFRAKSGVMSTRSVIFLPRVDSSSPAVEDVKRKMIDADPLDFIPARWKIEESRVPLVNKNISSKTSDEDEPVRRQRITGTPDEEAAADDRSTRSPLRAVSPPLLLPETAATGFLTLKIPSLGSLGAVRLHNWRNDCPVQALLSDDSELNPWKLSTPLVAARRRKSRKHNSRRAGQSIVWHNFPSSLSEILQLSELKLDYQNFISDDVDWQRFACEVEGVRAWEEQDPESAYSTRSQYAFINHSPTCAIYAHAVLPPVVEFVALVTFNEDGTERETAFPPLMSWQPFVVATRTSPLEMSWIAVQNTAITQPMPPPDRASQSRKPIRAAKRKMIEADSPFDPSIKPSPKRRRTRATPGSGQDTLSILSKMPQKLARTHRWLQNLSENKLQRMVISVVVVRTLAGGIDGFIDWTIVMELFPSRRDGLLKSSWKILSDIYHSDIGSLTDEFQVKYINALESGEVSSVNFDDMKATDWSGIVDWALKSLDRFSLKTIMDLPASRGEFLGSYTLDIEERKNFHDLLPSDRLHVREEVIKSSIFGTSHDEDAGGQDFNLLRHQPRFEIEFSNTDMRIAKTWVLATVFTPDSVFVPDLVQQKLSTLSPSPQDCEALLNRVLKLLEDERFIQRRPYSRRPPESSQAIRGWERHPKCFERLEERSMITPRMLLEAAQYKLDMLDTAFAKGDSIKFVKDGMVPEAHMLAVLNLMAVGVVRVRAGADVPKSRYGIDHERVGYKMKGLDRKLLDFSVEIGPVEGAYVFGNPMPDARKLPLPRGTADEVRGAIPPWINIHGTINVELWEMFLVSTLGFVALMPGISAQNISRAFGLRVDRLEVEIIMQWAVQAGFAELDEFTKGYQTLEWWWMCMSK